MRKKTTVLMLLKKRGSNASIVQRAGDEGKVGQMLKGEMGVAYEKSIFVSGRGERGASGRTVQEDAKSGRNARKKIGEEKRCHQGGILRTDTWVQEREKRKRSDPKRLFTGS